MNDYFVKRLEQFDEQSFKDVLKFERELAKIYFGAIEESQLRIDAFFARYATDGILTLQEAERLNRLNDLIQELDRLHSSLTGEAHTAIETHLIDQFNEAYAQTHYLIATSVGVGVPYAKAIESDIRIVLSQPWSGAEWSNRIWSNKTKLVDTLRQELIRGLVQGRGTKAIARDLRKKMDVSTYNAQRIVRTETNFIQGQAKLQAYAKNEINQYEVISTFDKRTSSICQSMDGKVFKLEEAVVGKTMNPFHVNCRTHTAPFIKDLAGYRRARDLNGESFLVPRTMSYSSFKEQYLFN